MKRFAIAALILISVLACTKSNIQYEPTGEISLQPVAEKATKAAHTTTAYGEAAPAFNVWAWWANVEPGKSIAEFLSSDDIDSYIEIGVSRAFTAIPGHFCFGVVMGYYYSLAAFENKNKQRNRILTLTLKQFLATELKPASLHFSKRARMFLMQTLLRVWLVSADVSVVQVALLTR